MSVTKKNVYIISVCAAAIIGSCVLVTTSQAGEIKYEDLTEFRNDTIVECTTVEYEFPTLPYQEMGYANLQEYWEDTQARRAEATGMADTAIEKYGSILTDEEKVLLREYEDDMLNAVYVDDFDNAMANFNAIVAECQAKISVSSSSSNSSYSNSSYYSSGGEGVLTRSGGVNYYNGRKETWYSQRVLPGGGLDIPGRHVNAEDGTIRDEDGYICVAASDLPKGTIVETSLGTGKVYDTGCAAGTTDIYTDW